ncbi:polysaccharide lyase family 7 protein [Corallincola spongiicola]|nr:polysaccharide lyase family 7 protein [Corallincola spongiicola]
MSTTRKYRLMSSVAAIVCLFQSPLSVAKQVKIYNPGFESDAAWSGWTDSEPSSISGVAHFGKRSAKIAGQGGRFYQYIDVERDTDYQLIAHVKGSGKVGVIAGDTHYTEQVSKQSNWKRVVAEFNSGDNGNIEIFAEYYKSEGRFDSFKLIKMDAGSVPVPSDPNTGVCGDLSMLQIYSATDDGTNDGHGPENTLDGGLGNESRWSSKGLHKELVFDLKDPSVVKAAAFKWYKARQRISYFDIETSIDKANWQRVLSNGESASDHPDFFQVDIEDSEARYVKIIGRGNSDSAWNSLIEARLYGCVDGQDPTDPTEPTDPPSPELNPSLPPSSNFDLSDWYLSVPTDIDGSGTADSIKEKQLNAGYESSDYFYTGADGGMVFVCPITGYKTSKNTSYTRSELREMLRRGNTSISTGGVSKNNWVFSSAPRSAQNQAGGVNGVLEATLAVNHVTKTGSRAQVGRVIVGQIHANDDEPLRIYYRKLPNHKKGSVYFAHEPRTGKEQWYEMIGSKDDNADEPADGIALNERFGYRVDVVANTLTVTITRPGKEDVVKRVDMSDSGYDDGKQYMYFKAGVYNQNKTGHDNDYVQATFYSLSNHHEGYEY